MKNCEFIFVYYFFLGFDPCQALPFIGFDHMYKGDVCRDLKGTKVGQVALKYYYSKDFTLVQATDKNKNEQTKVDDQTTYFDFHNVKERDYAGSENEEYTVIRYNKEGEPEAVQKKDLEKFDRFLHKPSFAMRCMSAFLGDFWSSRQKSLVTFTLGAKIRVENYTFQVTPVRADNSRADTKHSELKLATDSSQYCVDDCKITHGVFWNLHQPYTYTPLLTAFFSAGAHNEFKAPTLHAYPYIADTYEVNVKKNKIEWQPEKNRKTLNVLPTVAAVALVSGAFVGACTYFGRR